jgi:hypothetical protein
MQYPNYIEELPAWAKDDAKETWIKKSHNDTLYGLKAFEMIQCEQKRQCLQKTLNRQVREQNATREAIIKS